MWISKDGSVYTGDRRAEDRREPATQAEIDAWQAAQQAAQPDQSNLDNIAGRDKAILLSAAAMAGKTPVQAKAAFKAAWDALQPAASGK